MYSVKIPVPLRYRTSADSVLFTVLADSSFCIGMLVRRNGIKIRYNNTVFRKLFSFPLQVHGAGNKFNIFNRNTGLEQIGSFDNLVFSHAKKQKIRPAVDEDAAFYPIRPVIIVCKPPQTGFNAANENRNLLSICFPNSIAIDNGSMVGTKTGFSSGGIKVGVPAFFCCSIMIDHRINISCRNQKAKPRFSECFKRITGVPVRLCNNADRVAVGFQNSGNNGRSKAGMIHIGIPYDIDKIQNINSSILHIFF